MLTLKKLCMICNNQKCKNCKHIDFTFGHEYFGCKCSRFEKGIVIDGHLGTFISEQLARDVYGTKLCHWESI